MNVGTILAPQMKQVALTPYTAGGNTAGKRQMRYNTKFGCNHSKTINRLHAAENEMEFVKGFFFSALTYAEKRVPYDIEETFP